MLWIWRGGKEDLISMREFHQNYISDLHFSFYCCLTNYCILPCIRCIHVFGPNFQEKKSFILIFNSIFIYLYLHTYFLYYKGILAFIFEYIMEQEILCNKNYKTQEQIRGTRNFMYQ